MFSDGLERRPEGLSGSCAGGSDVPLVPGPVETHTPPQKAMGEGQRKEFESGLLRSQISKVENVACLTQNVSALQAGRFAVCPAAAPRPGTGPGPRQVLRTRAAGPGGSRCRSSVPPSVTTMDGIVPRGWKFLRAEVHFCLS